MGEIVVGVQGYLFLLQVSTASLLPEEIETRSLDVLDVVGLSHSRSGSCISVIPYSTILVDGRADETHEAERIPDTGPFALVQDEAVRRTGSLELVVDATVILLQRLQSLPCILQRGVAFDGCTETIARRLSFNIAS